MAFNPLASARRLQNPTIHGSPWRYSANDVGASALLNRKPAWFGLFVPWVQICGSRLTSVGHDPTAGGRDASFYDNAAAIPPAIVAQQPYETDTVGGAGGASFDIEMKQLIGLFPRRDYAEELLSQFYDQTEYQKQALEFAIRAQWENTAINGNSGVAPTEFDGLTNLFKQTLATAFNSLKDIDAAMQLCVAQNRRVDLIVMNQDAWRRMIGLERAAGYRPETRFCDLVGMNISYYNGVPVCISDHIATTPGPPDRSSVFVMSLGEPNGVFAIVNENAPEIEWQTTQMEEEPFKNFQGSFYSALVSPTSDALVELTAWDVTP